MDLEHTASSNVSVLLDPIPGGNPCGDPLRYTDVYDKIREARREDDEHLPQGIWKTEYKKADWEYVSHLCQDALMNKSKDIQIAAWLTEAWLHTDGPAGVAKGIELLIGLTQNFWKDLYPQATPQGFELRLAPFEWINLKLSDECQYILISLPTDRAALPYYMIDYNEATRHSMSPQKKQNKGNNSEASSKPSLVKINFSIDQTPTAFYRYMDESCSLALKMIFELEEELRVHLDAQAPTFYRLREKIESTQRFANHVLSQRGEKKNASSPTPANVSSTEPAKQRAHLSIESRDQAYKALEEIAGYLERIEPHSPTPYLIRRAITWGGLNLSELFSDIINNGQDISLLLDIVNVKKNKSQAGI